MAFFFGRKALIAVLMAFPIWAQADFGEIDLVVRESIGRFFDEYHREVDLKTLKYFGDPKITGNKMTVNTTVYGVEGYERTWVWHDCYTNLRRNINDVWVDEGSECSFEWN